MNPQHIAPQPPAAATGPPGCGHPQVTLRPAVTAPSANPNLNPTMSNKSIEQALAHLIPTHADALPPEIVSLASSLYAQSWVHGSALKPEEEIARPHACAEIACKR
ncbi:hypothetical protein KEM52_002271 [Ascosphaera acerosa]|nr:hypothetical protein KEM52_002271 [Ascosphaera acerosa]